MTKHTVKAFSDELDDLAALVARLGGLAEAQLAGAVDLLRSGDGDLAGQLVADDRILDRLTVDIDAQVVQILALRQPMARDLRQGVAAMKTAGELERIGDLAKGIARRIGEQDAPFPRNVAGGVQRMGRRTLTQVKDALDAYAERNIGKARAVWLGDKELDEMFNSIFRELLTYMLEDHGVITTCTDLLFIAKHLERAGDHSTNIAETVIFLETGALPYEERPKGGGG